MNLSRALRVDRTTRLALVGSGGKTTALFKLARQFETAVIVTASTHLGVWQLAGGDAHHEVQTVGDVEGLSKTILRNGVSVITGPSGPGGRTEAVSAECLLAIRAMADAHDIPVLIEADGSRQRPLKAPAPHEPAIPEWVNYVVVVAGLSGLGMPLDDRSTHRAEAFAALTGLTAGSRIDAQTLVKYLLHREGGLKNIPPSARRVALLNQADTAALQEEAAEIADGVKPGYDACLVASLNAATDEVFSVKEPVAGIVLAAGAARRFGKIKVLLDWHGKPLVWHVAKKALRAGLEPVVVVAGEHFEKIKAALEDLTVQVIENAVWESGQSSSLRAGLGAVGNRAGAAIFLLADQPKVPVEVINNLQTAHSHYLAPIIAPNVNGQRANPVLFDRVTFPDLKALTGDTGGRALFQRIPVTEVDYPDPVLLLDVDTEEDYRKLLDTGSEP